LIENPAEMIKGIVTLAPAINLRVALWNLVDYIDMAMSAADNEGQVGVISIEDILEVITQSMVKLDYDLDDGFHVGGQVDNGNNNRITNEEVEKFRKLLGIDPDEENKEE
jgi:CBS domain containing-hemolysin-like protein